MALIYLRYEDVQDVVKWMIENTNTELLTLNDHYQIEKIVDDCHLALMNKRKIIYGGVK